MNRNILVAIENTKTGPCANSPADIARVFGASSWVEVAFHGGNARITNSQLKGLEKSIILNASLSEREWLPSELYLEIAKALPERWQFFRVRNFQYPLTDLFAKEISASFSPASYDYVISTAEEAMLDDFFIERLSQSSLRAVQKMKLMPPGYFNGSVLPRAGRHFPSLELKRFYLEKHFEIMLPSPKIVCIDIVPTCNYACRKCHFHSPLLPPYDSHEQTVKRVPPRPPMSVRMVESVVERLKTYSSPFFFHAYMAGELLLHPELISILQIMQKHGFSPTFSSNGSLLTEEMSLRLLDIGIKYIGFSIDALTPNLYKRLQGGDLQQVERNIMRWQELYLKKYDSNFNGSIMFVVNSDNIDQMYTFYDTWTARGFAVLFNVELDVFTRLPVEVFPRRWRMPPLNYCVASNYLYLNSEADVLTCCAQHNPPAAKSPLNFLNFSPEEIWRHPWRQKVRETLLSGDRFDFCHACHGMGVMNYSTWVHEDGRTFAVSNMGWYGYPPADWKERSDWLQYV